MRTPREIFESFNPSIAKQKDVFGNYYNSDVHNAWIGFKNWIQSNPPSDNWRPIKTAPKGEDVLVFDLNYGRITAFMDETGIWKQNGEIDFDMSLVTHWQPLPGPPPVEV